MSRGPAICWAAWLANFPTIVCTRRNWRTSSKIARRTGGPMKIAGVASALPEHKYDQRVLLQALQKHWGPKVDNPVFLERLQARVGVETRYLALPIQEYYGLTRWGDANNKWIEVALDLGQKALCCALSRAGLSTNDLGAIF